MLFHPAVEQLAKVTLSLLVRQ